MVDFPASYVSLPECKCIEMLPTFLKKLTKPSQGQKWPRGACFFPSPQLYLVIASPALLMSLCHVTTCNFATVFSSVFLIARKPFQLEIFKIWNLPPKKNPCLHQCWTSSYHPTDTSRSRCPPIWEVHLPKPPHLKPGKWKDEAPNIWRKIPMERVEISTMPGKILPSINSREAPPPVETKETLSWARIFGQQPFESVYNSHIYWRSTNQFGSKIATGHDSAHPKTNGPPCSTWQQQWQNRHHQWCQHHLFQEHSQKKTYLGVPILPIFFLKRPQLQGQTT